LEMRKEHAEELDILVGGWTFRNEAEKVMNLLQSAGVHAGIVQNAEDLAKDPHLRSNAFFVDLGDPLFEKTVIDRSPIRMSGISTGQWKPAPLLGSDNQYVYQELLGFGDAEYQAYLRRGVIG